MTHDLPGWRKSAHSSAGADCVEVSLGTEEVVVRDSHDPDGPVLTFRRRQWEEFIAACKDGRLTPGTA